MADERWLDVADNRGEWARLRRALALEQGFALFVVDVPDVETEGRVVELIGREREGSLVLDARGGGEQAPVRELLRRPANVAVLRGVEASRRDVEALERCLTQLNGRRDQLAARGHVLVIVLRRDAVARMVDVAPDLYSVHRSQFRFATLVGPHPAPLWLLPDVEYAMLFADERREFSVRVLEWRGEVDVDVFGLWSSTWPAPEHSAAARLFARCEGVRSLVPTSPEVLEVLESPSFADIGLLHDAVRRSPSMFVAHMCAAALVWLYRSESRLSEARSALDQAKRHGHVLPYFATRVSLLERYLEVAEGRAGGSYEPSRAPKTLVAAAVLLSRAELEWAVAPSANATDTLRAVQAWIEWGGQGSWRLEPCFAALPRELVRVVNSDQRCSDVLGWLRERFAPMDPGWTGPWVEHLMIARALGHVADLVDLGRAWVATPGRQRIYDVWRPLVDVHAEANDLDKLEQLIRMPLAPDAPERFGPKLGAALHVTADVLDRGLIELPPREREQLRARAAAREGLPLTMRLGWWAIELALGDR